MWSDKGNDVLKELLAKCSVLLNNNNNSNNGLQINMIIVSQQKTLHIITALMIYNLSPKP